MRPFLLAAMSGVAMLTSISTQAANQVATVPTGEGKIFAQDNLLVVRKTFSPEHPMKKHHHPGAEVVVTIVKGQGTFTMNDTEKHELKAGGVLIFNGDNYIQGDFPEETLVVVSLVEQK